MFDVVEEKIPKKTNSKRNEMHLVKNKHTKGTINIQKTRINLNHQGTVHLRDGKWLQKT